MDRVIKRFSEHYEGRLWYRYICYCGVDRRYLNGEAMINSSIDHRDSHGYLSTAIEEQDGLANS